MSKLGLTPYSQYLDLFKPGYKKTGCGITCLGMFLGKKISNLDELYELGLEQNAYQPEVGWRHKGLAELASSFGLTGSYNLDLAEEDMELALVKLKTELAKGPVVVSVFAKYKPGNTEGHLAVLLNLDDQEAVLLDPATRDRAKIELKMSAQKFIKAWKKRLVVFRD
ncbi:MAG: hypothetical protein A2571_01310 [Candidatus Vogelbacteria bacterium RIFOXYD1_FULL_44_32]|uniref:Peptidase C39 domain-containing protein n=1 Tax=Candidatus Vogelbacteria bacterium RIFOXYD1_FULL_44_32 TaxID=1802438 RepID=A0A1G2QCV2_9BACT|nr:MAG: hypothetical protein A2571_01310 [Candidatus Vogelbacteria bacterium RIFOXYD1_FULL_44_32]